MQRARETCELAGFGQNMIVDPDLVEWDYGAYEGLTPKEIHELAPGWLIFRDGCPGGETPEKVGARVDRNCAYARPRPRYLAVRTRTRVARARGALDRARPGWRPALSLGHRHAVRPQLLP